MKLLSWNVNGLRSIYKKGFAELAAASEASIICVQETKTHASITDQLPPPPAGFSSYFSSAKKPGYSGVATFIKPICPLVSAPPRKGIGKSAFDDEGRFLITDHGDFLLYNIYFPSGTTGDTRQKFKYKFLDSLLKHIQELPKRDRDRLILCGDFNICHRPIDIHHPEIATKRELSGFLPDERKWIDLLIAHGFVDAFRMSHGDTPGIYSWWTYRAGARGKNLGWRIDYFFVATKLAKRITGADILTNIHGSDHCPITLELDI